MNYKINVKRLGNRWYLNIDHTDPRDIAFNDKLCKVFSLYDTNNSGELEIELIELHSLVYDNTIFINGDDLLRYFTTSDNFEMRFLVRDHEFSIYSEMYSLIECNFNTNFHKTYYRIEIYNRTV